MTINSIRTNKEILEFTIPSTKNCNFLTEAIDTQARKKINSCRKLEFSPVKRNFDTAFLSDASAANDRINKIAFPKSPTSSPTKCRQNQSPARFEKTPPLFVMPEMELEKMPDFSNPFKLDVQESKAPPQRPTKRPKVEPTASKFQKQHEALCSNTFKYKVTYLAKGSFSNCYTLENNIDPIIPGVDNSDLVLKAYHGENSGFGELKLRNFIKNAIENYHAAVNAGFPVATIYNAETALQDGYIIQRKISGKIDPFNAEQRSQVSRFFDVSVKNRVIFDLQAQNFTLENGQVVLVDFIEDPDDDDALDAFNKKVIENWLKVYRKTDASKDQAKAYLNELSANHYQQFIQETLDQFA
jgi:hypothetical protein